jgi:hypothetical protein
MTQERGLVALVDEITKIEVALIDSGGELPKEMEELFDLTQGDLRSKVDRYKYMMDAMEARSVYFKERADEMAHARKIFDNQKLRLKDRMKFAMDLLKATDLEGNDWRFKLTQNDDRLEINSKDLDPAYTREEVVKVPDAERIRSDLSLGLPVQGAQLVASMTLRSYVNKVGKAKLVKEAKK